jgi:hypothetical protein
VGIKGNKMANQFFYNTGKMFAKHMVPVLLDCNFVVDSTNGNGLGIRNLKGPGVLNVYMNTSATPATGNPNPAAGFIYIQLTDSYYRSISGFNATVNPLSGTPISISGAAVLTLGVGYVITSVGTSTAANWQAMGLPVGVVPAPGVPFIATSTGLGTGTGQVEATVSSGIQTIVTVGDPTLSVSAPAQLPVNLSQSTSLSGGYLILACMGATDATHTALIPTAPANNTVISIAMYLSNSSVLVAGE